VTTSSARKEAIYIGKHKEINCQKLLWGRKKIPAEVVGRGRRLFPHDPWGYVDVWMHQREIKKKRGIW
jgi:hypothetical protein